MRGFSSVSHACFTFPAESGITSYGRRSSEEVVSAQHSPDRPRRSWNLGTVAGGGAGQPAQWSGSGRSRFIFYVFYDGARIVRAGSCRHILRVRP